MLKKNAIQAFVYYGNNIYGPTGRKILEDKR